MSDNCQTYINPVFQEDFCKGEKTSTICVVDPNIYTELGLEINSSQEELNQAIYQALLAQKGISDDLQEIIDNLPSGIGATNLDYVASSTTGLVTSDTGNDAIVPLSTTTDAGLLSPTDKIKLNNTSGVNSGDENTSSIQTKRPLKTIEGQSLEGIGNIDLTKSDVELNNVDNTTDLLKPISTSTQNALNLKQDTLVSSTNIKTINGASILGSGDLVVSGGGSVSDASTTIKGIIKLAGDLGGTADLPTTPTAVHKTGNEVIAGQKNFNDTVGGNVTAIQANKLNTSGYLIDIQTASATAGGTLLHINSTTGNANTNTAKLLVLDSGTLSTGIPFTVQNNGIDTLTISKEGDLVANKFTKIGGTPSQYLMADGSVSTSSSAYKSYIAIISQTGTNAPTITNLVENTLGVTVTLSRVSAGYYLASFSSAVIGSNRDGFASNNFSSNNTPIYIILSSFGTSSFNFQSNLGTVQTDGLLNQARIEFRVYN